MRFSGANLDLVKAFYLDLVIADEKKWEIDEVSRTDSMISAYSPAGTGKDHQITYDMGNGIANPTGRFFSYAAPVIYNITA